MVKDISLKNERDYITSGTSSEKIEEAQSTLEKMLSAVNEIYPGAEAVLINPKELVFEERAKFNCFYCGKYNNNWHCPPNLPDLDYQKMFNEYDNGAFVCTRIPLDNPDARTESSIINHRSLLIMEKWLWDNDNSTAVSFIAGSCKLCRNGCAPDKCANPYQARSPLEATGCNVIKSAQKAGISIEFPPKEYMLRVGLIVW